MISKLSSGSNDADVTFTFRFFSEGNNSVNQSEQRVIFSDANTNPGMMPGAALTNQNVAGFGCLSAEKFYSESFTVGFTAVLGTTYPFFVCHGLCFDSFDGYQGKMLTVTVQLAIAFPPFLFEDKYLVAFGMT